MIIRKADDAPGHQVDLEGAKGVTFRMLLGESEGVPNFYMRQFDVAPGGRTPRHAHPWEHECYILAGEGVLVTEAGDRPVRAGDCVFVAPEEVHRFQNAGPGVLKFLCLVPRASK